MISRNRDTNIAVVVLVILSIVILGGLSCLSSITPSYETIDLHVTSHCYETVTLNILINGRSIFYERIQYGYSRWIYTNCYFYEGITIKAIVTTSVFNEIKIYDTSVTVSIKYNGYPDIYYY